MSNRKGWVKLHRKIVDNPLWQEKPYDKAHAWLDLILLTNSQETKVTTKYGKEIRVMRSELFTSVRFLCQRWGWTEPKVGRFLNMLVDRGMIMHKSFPAGTAIKILNYEKYQGKQKKSVTENVTPFD